MTKPLPPILNIEKMRKKSRSRRHAKTKRNPPNTISSPEDARSHPPNTISSPEDGVMDSGAVSDADEIDKGDGVMNSDADEIDKGSYTPLSFYLDSAVNHPGPILKGYRFGFQPSESIIAESIGKNSIPLSSYPTNLVYHPAQSIMDIFLDPIAESKLDIFLDPTGESIMDVFIDSEGEQIKYSPYMGIFRPLSFYIDPSASFTGRKNYIRAPVDMGCKSSQSKVSFCFQSSESKFESMVSGNYIPEEIAFSVLLKLPVKSLKRFGCVCKSWSILFENTDFMTMYTKHFISRHGSDDRYCTFILANQFYVDSENRRNYQSEFHLLEKRLKLNLPSPLQQSRYHTCILGSTSVNGIFCLAQPNYHRDKCQPQYVLWNPLTEEFMVIPSSPTQLTPKHPNGMAVTSGPRFHGFGYDQLRDDFKVIRYVLFVCHLYPHHTTSFFEIYSLNSNSWRVINMENHLSHWSYPPPFDGLEVYVDGACHWLVSYGINSRTSMTLLSFDLSDEVFLTTPIGEEPDYPYFCDARLAVLNGSIALISNYHDDIVFQIFILGELGVSESWIKLYTYGSFPSIQWPPIGFGKMGYIYVTKKDYEVAYVDLSHIIKKSLLKKDYEVAYVDAGITGGSRSIFFGGLYKESQGNPSRN